MATSDDKLAARLNVDISGDEPEKLPATVAAKSRKRLTEVWMTKAAEAEAKKTAEIEAYVEYHREHAMSLLLAKQAIIQGLLSEMTVNDGEGGVVLDTKLMDTKRLKLLQDYIVQWENRGYGSFTHRVERTQKSDLLSDFLAVGNDDE